MKRFFLFLRTRPIAFVSVVVIVLMYIMMIFAEFFAPYEATRSFKSETYHPANIEVTVQGLVVRECRVLDPLLWNYAKVRGLSHPLRFFVHGYSYTLLGIIPCDIHLFGTEVDQHTGEQYPVFLIGADHLGRDLFSRIVHGSRISLTIGFVATAISMFLAILLGGVAGYYSGAVDWSIMRFAEFFMLIPSVYLILFLRSLMSSSLDSGTGYMIITLILSLVGWPGSARMIRGIVHSLKREEFIMDADLEGVPSLKIIFCHMIPQISSLLIVGVALSIPGFIMSETVLSYLNLGIDDPAVSWGSLINHDISTLSNLRNYPWLLVPLWLLLCVTLAFNFLGDALRDFFDPYHSVFKKWKLHHFTDIYKASASFDVSRKQPLAADTCHLLSVQDLHVTFRVFRGTHHLEVQSVRGVSFYLNKGEVLGIVGESGSGKSVTTSAIPGLLPENAYVQGHIFFDGMDLTGLSKKELRLYRGNRIGLILQEPGRSFDPLQTIGGAFLETFRNHDPHMSKKEAYDRAVDLLTEVGIPDPRGRLINYPHQFSGGQLQRIGIALALAQGCDLLIADEPTTALDVTIQTQIVSLLVALQKNRGLSIIFISHNIDLVSHISDRIIVMYGGKIMEQGKTSDIIEHPKHPYTQALLASSPRFGTHYTTSTLASIPGKVTDPSTPEPGCPFAPRCSFKQESCINADCTCYKMAEYNSQQAATDKDGM
ncbi:MAG: ATP-binding cassette domain-containing protein [Treponema sp.]|nr:ATP-binding cassette domain-containing protein [Treponema sp.]